MSRFYSFSSLRAAAALMLLAPQPGFLGAQTSSAGVISTFVLDPSGAPVANAQVRLEAVSGAAKNAARMTATGADGRFSLPAVAGERYTLTVAVPGFRTVTARVVGGEPPAAMRLQIADAAEHIDVNGTSGGGRVDPEETEGGVTLEGTEIAAIPLNGRSFTDELAVTPGVVPVSSAQPNAVVMSGVGSTPPSGNLNIGALSVSGQRETANAFRVNGSDVQENVNMGVAVIPTLDSIAELQVLTDDFDARLGNQSGGQVLVTTRAGGDHLHGSLFDYYRDTALDARSYFSLERAPFHQNQFGATLGGPVPHSRLKFFADYQGTRQLEGLDSGEIGVPSVANRAGDLGDSLASLTGTVSGASWAQSLSSRLGYAVQNGEPYHTAGCTSTAYSAGNGVSSGMSSSTGCVFPTGVIPRSAWSAPAVALLPYIPSPNIGASTFGSASYAESVRDDKGAMRLDLATRAGQLSLYGFADDYNLLNPYPTQQGGANVPGFSARNQGRAQLYAANLTTTFGAGTVNTAHLSYLRNAATVGQPVGGQGISLGSQGFVAGAGTDGIVPLAPAIEGVENVVFNSFTLGTTVTGLSQAENLSEVTDDASRAVGRHLFSAGVGFHTDQINTHPNVYDNGSFSFTGSETGLDFADFLLGIDSSYTQGEGQNFYNRNHYLGLYAQDSWRATPTFTLNYGLRWDVLPPWYEKYNQLLSLDPNEQSVVFPTAPKGLLVPGDPGVPRTLSPTRYTNFAPRVAGSWSPARLHGTLVRAGYGLYYTAFEGLSAGIISGNPPYGFTDTLPAPTLFNEPFVEADNGQSLGQRFPLAPVPFGASPTNPNAGVNWADYEPLTGIPAFAMNNVTPYSENYTLAVEQQLGAKTTATLAYVGTQAHHLLVVQEVNPGNPALCLALSQTSEVAPGSATCGPFNESNSFTAANGTVYGGTRSAFSSAFGSVNLQKTIANAHDNALEANLQHAGRNLYVQLAYTWSKSIDQSSSLAEAVYPETAESNAGLSRALSAFDMRHNFSAVYRYTLPLERLAPNRPRLLGDWQITGLTRFGTGLPVTLMNNNDTSLLGTAPNGINNNGIDEPAFAGGDLKIHHRPDAAGFNTTLFSQPALGTLGNARRRVFYGPGVDNTDLALSKKTALWESMTLELRAEAFNVFNHGQFFGPTAVQGNLSAANFGQIQTASPPRLMQLSGRIAF